MYSRISSPLSVMRILQPAGSAAAMMEDTKDMMRRRDNRQEVILNRNTSTWHTGDETFSLEMKAGTTSVSLCCQVGAEVLDRLGLVQISTTTVQTSRPAV